MLGGDDKGAGPQLLLGAASFRHLPNVCWGCSHHTIMCYAKISRTLLGRFLSSVEITPSQLNMHRDSSRHRACLLVSSDGSLQPRSLASWDDLGRLVTRRHLWPWTSSPPPPPHPPPPCVGASQRQLPLPEPPKVGPHNANRRSRA